MSNLLEVESQPLPAPKPKPVMWSASSWAAWKQCPMKVHLREQKWSHPSAHGENRMAVLAMPGLVVDKLFELWLHRREFENFDWIKDNFDMIWSLVESKSKPKWYHVGERSRNIQQTQRSSLILFELLHQHGLLNPEMGIQTEFHIEIVEGISIAGAIDLWTVRPDGTLVVVDFKNFGSKTPRSVDQLHFYALALKKLRGHEPTEAGFVCFHPAYKDYRKNALRLADRNKLLSRLVRATEARRAGEFKAKYNYVTCPRFCEARFRCPEFLKTTNLRSG